MDLTTVLTTGVLSAFLTVVSVGLVIKLYLPRLKADLVAESEQVISDYLSALPEKLKAKPELMAPWLELVAGGVVSMVNNPKFMSDLSKPVIEAFMKQAGQSTGADATIKLPIIGKVPVGLLMGLFGKSVQKGAEQAVEGVAGSLLG